MSHSAALSAFQRYSSTLAIPTMAETSLFLLAPERAQPKLLHPEWDEEDDVIRR
jgi:hypothetical protein